MTQMMLFLLCLKISYWSFPTISEICAGSPLSPLGSQWNIFDSLKNFKVQNVQNAKTLNK